MNRTRNLLVTAAAWLVPVLCFASEGGEHGEHGWDVSALIASGVNFVLLISLFVFMFRGPVSKALKERRAAVESALSEAAKLKAEAEAKHKEYSERLAKLDQELETIRKEMISAGEKERDRILAEAEHKAARMRREAEFLIEQQAKQLRADLLREATESAVTAAEQLLVKSTTNFDQQRLAQEYLSSLEQDSKGKKPKARPTTQESRV